jgi:hypothetical protein
VPREWSAIPRHGDIEDETVKRPRVLCHVDLSSLLTGSGSRLGRGQVEDGPRTGRGRVDKAESPRSWGMVLVVSSLEGDQ